MAFSTPHVLLTVEGNMSGLGQADIWRCTFKFPVAVGSIPTDANLTAFLESAASPITAFHVNNQVPAGNAAKLVSLAAAVIGVDGKYLGGGTQATVRHTYGTPINGGGTTANSWATACCLTLRTAKPRGAAAYGRAYWPATGAAVDVDGRLNPTNAAAQATAASVMLNALNAAAAANGFGVAGRVSVCSALGAGQNLPVVKVGIGRKLDRQERREDKLNEEHAYVNLAGAAELIEQARDAGVRF